MTDSKKYDSLLSVNGAAFVGSIFLELIATPFSSHRPISEINAENRGLIVREMPLSKYDGLILDEDIYINKRMPTSYKKCAIAEEIGHYHTTVGNILDQSVIANQEQEHKARVWAYREVLPPENIQRTISGGCRETWEIAECLDVSEPYLLEALEYYKTQGYTFGEEQD